jgi:ATP-dependent Clp protease ATP-binding subunit ClpA
MNLDPEGYTDNARVIVNEKAYAEAKAMLSKFVDTEHILLALAKESESAAGIVLRRLGITLEALRNELTLVLGAPHPPTKADQLRADVDKARSKAMPNSIDATLLLTADIFLSSMERAR